MTKIVETQTPFTIKRAAHFQHSTRCSKVNKRRHTSDNQEIFWIGGNFSISALGHLQSILDFHIL